MYTPFHFFIIVVVRIRLSSPNDNNKRMNEVYVNVNFTIQQHKY
jgi:hypothetical protein